MRENVGSTDRAVRSIAGPVLLGLGLTRLGARQGRLAGLLALIGGALITETAITRVCPLNAALGVGTRRTPAG